MSIENSTTFKIKNFDELDDTIDIINLQFVEHNVQETIEDGAIM